MDKIDIFDNYSQTLNALLLNTGQKKTYRSDIIYPISVWYGMYRDPIRLWFALPMSHLCLARIVKYRAPISLLNIGCTSYKYYTYIGVPICQRFSYNYYTICHWLFYDTLYYIPTFQWYFYNYILLPILYKTNIY